MEREKLQNSILVLALVFGLSSFAAAVYFHRDRESLSQQLKELSENAQEVVVAAPVQEIARPAPSGNDSEDIAQLNAYIERLEAQQANLKSQLESALADNRRQERGREGGWGGRRGGPPDLEELKTTDPERYERIQQRMAEMRQRAQEAATRRDEFFDSVDTSRMTTAQQDAFAEYRDLLAQADAVMRGEGNMEEMRDIGRGIFELRGQVQEALLEQLGSASGASDPAAFAANVRQIMSTTGGMGGPGGFGGGFGGPPGGFGGGPGRGGFGGRR